MVDPFSVLIWGGGAQGLMESRLSSVAKDDLEFPSPQPLSNIGFECESLTFTQQIAIPVALF